MSKVCGTCFLVKEDSEFYKNGKSLLTKRCKVCKRIWQNAYRIRNRDAINKRRKGNTYAEYNRQRYRTIKSQMVQYLGGMCNKCKQIFPDCVYDFHHIDPSKKELELGSRGSMKFEKLKLELDKCLLLCANCHRITHMELKDGISE